MENAVVIVCRGHDTDINDFEYNGLLGPRLLIHDILSCQCQAVVVVRKSEWIDSVYGDLEHYYFMKNGSLIPAANCLQKEIWSVNQLRNLFVKGSFNM